MKKRLHMRLIGVAAASIVAGTGMAACGAVTHTGLVAGTAAVRVPACRPHQLRLGNGPLVSEATQQEAAIFVLRNVSSHRCGLDGYLVVSLLTRRSVHSKVLPFRYRDRGDQMLTSAKPHLVVLAPGGKAYFGINKVTCVGHESAIARDIAVYPLGQLEHKLNRSAPVLGYCGRHDPGHVVDVSPVERTVRAVLARH